MPDEGRRVRYHFFMRRSVTKRHERLLCFQCRDHKQISGCARNDIQNQAANLRLSRLEIKLQRQLHDARIAGKGCNASEDG